MQAIQAKVSEAVKELPAGVLTQVAGSAEVPVDYFRAVQIRDKLAATGERSLFGGLTGQAGIWDKIVKAYENGGMPDCLSQHVEHMLKVSAAVSHVAFSLNAREKQAGACAVILQQQQGSVHYLEHNCTLYGRADW
jgi:hypothetical protein